MISRPRAPAARARLIQWRTRASSLAGTYSPGSWSPKFDDRIPRTSRAGTGRGGVWRPARSGM